jgi:glycosyltransferase involved in cell wall biosynthesis
MIGDLQASPNPPLVSIGLPVFNGAQFLGEAIESILSQTYRNIELVISDNASTDATPEICERVASRDRRVRYSRLSENIGGLPNHNRVASLATGKYFMWSSHDDLLMPTYAEKCVECLEKDAGVVLAYSKLIVIDDAGRVQQLLERSHSGSSPHVSARFGDFTEFYSMLEAYFGLIRRDVLAKTMLHLPHPGSDRILMAELALRGRFVRVPEHLFKRRRHAGRSVSVHPSLRERYVWISPSFKNKRVYPHWGYVAGFTRAVLRAPLAFRDRVSCAIVILRLVRRSWRVLLEDFKPAPAERDPRIAA